MTPNILLLFPDQHRRDWLPGDGELPVVMPNLAGLVDRGVRFTRAYTPSPICAPARACLASGLDYDGCRVPGNAVEYPLDQLTYYQCLRETGYSVAGVGKFDLHKPTQDWGLDGKRLLDEWGFTHGVDNEGKMDAVASGAERPMGPYMAYLHEQGLASTHVADFAHRKGKVGTYTTLETTPLPEHAYCDNWVASNALDVLSEVPVGKPWHLSVNFTGPHNPVDVTDGMLRGWENVEFPSPIDNNTLDAATHQGIRRRYAAMLQNIDRHIGRILARIAERGELANTLVVYSSDHGEMLGDHNRWAKGVHYEPSVGVPLVIAGPGVRPGVTSDALVSLQDLTATFLAVSGAEAIEGIDGRTLWPLLRGEATTHRSHVVSGLGEWRMVTDGRLKLVRGAAGSASDLLYDLTTDPYEQRDVADSWPEDVARLNELLPTLSRR